MPLQLLPHHQSWQHRHRPLAYGERWRQLQHPRRAWPDRWMSYRGWYLPHPTMTSHRLIRHWAMPGGPAHPKTRRRGHRQVQARRH